MVSLHLEIMNQPSPFIQSGELEQASTIQINQLSKLLIVSILGVYVVFEWELHNPGYLSPSVNSLELTDCNATPYKGGEPM